MFIGSKTQSRITFLSFALAAEHQTCVPRATNQICGAPRVTDAQIRYNLCLRDPSRPIFERLLILHPKTIFSHVLFQCEFQTIFALRLVSKTINDLVLSINTSISHSPLNDKAFIFFDYSDIYPNAESEVQEKFNFAQQYKTNVDITISIHDLLPSALTLNSIPDNRLSRTITIDNLDELLELTSLILNQPSLTLFSKIRAFNLSNLNITPDMTGLILSLLTIATQNPNLCFNLKQLAFGDIHNGVTLILPKELPNLETLSFESINNFWKLDLSESSFPKLTSLSFEGIGYAAKLVLPKVLPHLLTLSFTKISYYAKLDLSACFLPNLTSLAFGYILCDAELTLNLNQLPSLKHLECKDDRNISDCLPLLYLELKLAITNLLS